MEHTDKYLQAKWVAENPKGYDDRDVIDAKRYCNTYLEGYKQALRIAFVSGSLLRSKAKDYAKLLHQDEYNDPIYHRDILEAITNFEAGYKAAMKDCNDR